MLLKCPWHPRKLRGLSYMIMWEEGEVRGKRLLRSNDILYLALYLGQIKYQRGCRDVRMLVICVFFKAVGLSVGPGIVLLGQSLVKYD